MFDLSFVRLCSGPILYNKTLHHPGAHVGSPDTFIDDERRTFIMAFHLNLPLTNISCNFPIPGRRKAVKHRQCTFLATSADGNHFDSTPIVSEGTPFYRRRLSLRSPFVLVKTGLVMELPSTRSSDKLCSKRNFQLPRGLQSKLYLDLACGRPRKKVSHKEPSECEQPTNPQSRLISHARHVAVTELETNATHGTYLLVFTRQGDAPEHLLAAQFVAPLKRLENGLHPEPSEFSVLHKPYQLAVPEEEWEGSEGKVIRSTDGYARKEELRSLRDPDLLVVRHGTNTKVWLYYTGYGERTIGVVALIPSKAAPASD